MQVQYSFRERSGNLDERQVLEGDMADTAPDVSL